MAILDGRHDRVPGSVSRRRPMPDVGGDILGSGPRAAARPGPVRNRLVDGVRRPHALAQPGARAADGQAAGAPRRARRGRVATCSTSVPRCSTTPSAGRCSPTRRAASCAPSSATRRRLPDYRLYEVVVDSADPAMIATWWADRFGVEVHHDQRPGVLLAGRDRPGRRSRWSSAGCPSPRRSRTGCTGTYAGSWTSCSAPAPGCSGPAATTSTGTCWPTRRATSSASSPRTGRLTRRR